MEVLLSVVVRRSIAGILLLPALLFVTLCTPVYAQNLTDGVIKVVTQRLAESANHSWEYGTRAEVLLELNAPTYSVLSSSPIPAPQQIPSNLTSALHDVLSIAHTIVANRSISNGNITGPQPLIQDSSAGDPPSIGVAVLLANWTGEGGVDGLDYAGAARDQLDFLFQDVPKTSDGAFSHRMDQVQLWSDFIYMVPPFLAYYGAVTQNITLLEEAYKQISLYRKYLRDTKANNLWKHIQLGSYGTDDGHWSTGNAWAAAGMIRVLGTIQRSQYANSMKGQQTDLANWVREIHSGMYRHLDASGLFHNYADNTSTFLDASSTALLASTVYRLSLLWGVHTYLPLAELTRKTFAAPSGANVNISVSVTAHTITATSTMATFVSSLPSSVSASASASSSTPSPSPITPDMLHFTLDGWLTPVVDPYAYPSEAQNSPEGQAFILSMQAAWRDWVADGSKGANGSPCTTKCFPGLWTTLLVIMVAMYLTA
ncbi:Six-hairpin glycosidase-like protein [Phlebopus sp. FC_14]|nr:Six-hairpin glycosidase-like protein [Phlebopus sp. FC_14]